MHPGERLVRNGIHGDARNTRLLRDDAPAQKQEEARLLHKAIIKENSLFRALKQQGQELHHLPLPDGVIMRAFRLPIDVLDTLLLKRRGDAA